MATRFSFINLIKFIIFLVITYLIYVYFPILFPNNFMQIENLDNPIPSTTNTADVSGTVQDISGTVQDASAVLVVPGEDILQDLQLKAINDNNTAAQAYVTDYLKINNQYKQILKNQQAEQATTKYKADETYAPTFPNRMVSKIANSGMPFVGSLSKLYVPYPDSTICHNYIDNFDGWCKKEYGDNVDFGVGKPSQLVSGQVLKYPGACPGGLLGAGGQGRAQCEFGYAGLSKLPLNSTQCYFTAGGDFDKACRDQAGSGHDYKDGIMSDYIFGVQKYLPAGETGCLFGQRRAQCGLNYAGGYKLNSNSTQCKLNTTDWDGACRSAGGTKSGYGKNGITSQDTWGQKSLYEGSTSGCIGGQNRAECAKGYSAGQKLIDNSTGCYLWTDNFNNHCKSDYGKDWILNTTLTQPDPKDTKSGYGKYNGGCMNGQGRGVCIKKSDLAPDAELPGPICGPSSSIGSKWCSDEFGNEYSAIDQKTYDCGATQARPTCQNINNLPNSSTLVGNKCGQWLSISDSWCKNDYGSEWQLAKPVAGGCPGGSGKALCIKNPKIEMTGCSQDWWGKVGSWVCQQKFGNNSRYMNESPACSAGNGANYKCMTW